MDAVVTAGSRPLPNDPLYEATRGGYKALLDIAGKPMIQWVLDALSACPQVERVTVVGLPPYTNLYCDHPLTILEDQGGLLINTRTGVLELLQHNPALSHALLISSDVPALTPQMLQWAIDTMLETDHDFLYPVITRQVMEARYPGSRRTYLHLKDIEVCGADVLCIRSEVAAKANDLWSKIIDSRKNPIKQASLLGFDTLFMILLRQYSLEQASEAIGKRLGLRARGALCPYAEMGMDVDKPHQLALITSDLSQSRLKAAAG